MNAYKNLEIHKDPYYLEFLNKAEEQKKEIAGIILDKEKIVAFSREYGAFSDKNLELILEAVDKIADDEGYLSLCCALYYFIKNDIPVSGLKPPEDGSLLSEFVLMPALIANTSDFCEDAKKRGVDIDIITATVRSFDMYINANQRRKGRVGTSGYHSWLPLYAQGKLFKMKEFQFEIRTHQGEEALGVHIPNGTKLDVHENLISLKNALEFFKKHYGEHDFKGFVCESWLLNPYIKEIMGRETNITRFGDMFDRFVPDEEEFGVYISVFGVLEPESIDALCEDTSMQRNIKSYLKTGKEFKDFGGFISLEKLDNMLKSFS